jgi:hypothetical protein
MEPWYVPIAWTVSTVAASFAIGETLGRMQCPLAMTLVIGAGWTGSMIFVRILVAYLWVIN